MAINNIYCTLGIDKSLSLCSEVQINQGENKTTALLFCIPTQYSQYLFNLEFSCPHGRTYQTPQLNWVEDANYNSVLKYEIENALTYERGLVKMQLVARQADDYGVIFKSVESSMASFFVNESVNYIPFTYQAEDFFANATQRMDDLQAMMTTFDESIENAQSTMTAVNTLVAQITEDRNNGVYIGETGACNVLSIGQVSKGINPSVTITGESPAQVLNFVLPKGDKGDKGNTGTRGSMWHKGNTLIGMDSIVSTNANLINNCMVGDYYINVTSGYYYNCIGRSGESTTWEYVGCLIGPAGSTTLGINTEIQNIDNGKVILCDNGYLGSIGIDDQITQNSGALAKSGSVYSALAEKQNNLVYDNAPTIGSQNILTSNVVANCLAEKQDTLVYDNAPTLGSTNAVNSGAIASKLAEKQEKILYFGNVVIATADANSGIGFLADTSNNGGATYSEYPYRASVPLTNVTSAMLAEVVLGCDDATSGKYAPVVETYDGGVWLYCKNTNTNTITVPMIKVEVM